jgi:hypothetical protein
MVMQTWSNLTSQAWISRLWAEFNKLPEPVKDSFVFFAQSMEKIARSECESNLDYSRLSINRFIK